MIKKSQLLIDKSIILSYNIGEHKKWKNVNAVAVGHLNATVNVAVNKGGAMVSTG